MSPRNKEQLAQIRKERHDQILDAANRIFASKGFDAANVSDIAAAANVSQGTIYHYFSSKDELLMAVFEEWEAAFFDNLPSESSNVLKTTSDQLRAFARATARLMEGSTKFLPLQIELWTHLVRNQAIRKRFQKLFRNHRTMLSQIIQKGINSGEFRPINADTLASIAVAAYDGLILQWLADPKTVHWQQVSDVLMETILKGLALVREDCLGIWKKQGLKILR